MIRKAEKPHISTAVIEQRPLRSLDHLPLLALALSHEPGNRPDRSA